MINIVIKLLSIRYVIIFNFTFQIIIFLFYNPIFDFNFFNIRYIKLICEKIVNYTKN